MCYKRTDLGVLGDLSAIKSNVRVIASTNEEPCYSIENNKMRKDVYYRISTVTITIPPLRERREDIAILVQYFIDKLSRQYSKTIVGVSNEVIKIFYLYEWQGNVRELLHVTRILF